ncbi:MAG: hypothetical protein NTNFB01_22330 [Nitrospira sp.]
MNLQRGDEFLQERGALHGFCATADLEFVMFVRLIFRRFFTEQSSDRFTKGEFGSGADGFSIGKSVPAQIVDLNAQFAECGDAACEFINDVRFGFAA